MSQHRWKTEDAWDVMAGWDRPLQYFFLQISQECQCQQNIGPLGLPIDDCTACDGEGEIYLYDNLRDRELVYGAMSLAQVQAKLERYLSTVPHGVLEALVLDPGRDTGRDITAYPVTGTVLGLPWKQ